MKIASCGQTEMLEVQKGDAISSVELEFPDWGKNGINDSVTQNVIFTNENVIVLIRTVNYRCVLMTSIN